MKRYFIQEDYKESRPNTLDFLSQRGLSPDGLIRQENKTDWQPAGQSEETTKLFPDQSISQPPEKRQTETTTFGISKKTLEFFLPFFIALLIGTVTISMGRFIKNQGEPRKTSFNTKTVSNVADKKSGSKAASGSTDKNATVYDSVSKDAALPDSREKPVLSPTVDHDKQADYIRSNWWHFMTLSSGKLKRRVFGGIKDFTLTFTNNSGYKVDGVVAEITYVKGNGKPLHTQEVSLSAVPAHSKSIQKVGSSWRGKNVHVRIKKLSSHSLHLHYEGDSNSTK